MEPSQEPDVGDAVERLRRITSWWRRKFWGRRPRDRGPTTTRQSFYSSMLSGEENGARLKFNDGKQTAQRNIIAEM